MKERGRRTQAGLDVEREIEEERRLRRARITAATGQAPEPEPDPSLAPEADRDDDEDHAAKRIEQQTLWVDMQVRKAMERGEFDNLPGAGKPLPGAGRPDDENWWLTEYLRREGVTGDVLLPTALLLRREIDELPALVRRMPSESRVREAVSELNVRIVDCLREPSDLRVPLRPVNADAVVERWRAERAERAVPGETAAEAAAAPPEGIVGRRRWWRRFGRA